MIELGRSLMDSRNHNMVMTKLIRVGGGGDAVGRQAKPGHRGIQGPYDDFWTA